MKMFIVLLLAEILVAVALLAAKAEAVYLPVVSPGTEAIGAPIHLPVFAPLGEYIELDHGEFIQIRCDEELELVVEQNLIYCGEPDGE